MYEPFALESQKNLPRAVFFWDYQKTTYNSCINLVLIASTEGCEKYYESIQSGDVIECIGSVEYSDQDENDNLDD